MDYKAILLLCSFMLGECLSFCTSNFQSQINHCLTVLSPDDAFSFAESHLLNLVVEKNRNSATKKFETKRYLIIVFRFVSSSFLWPARKTAHKRHLVPISFTFPCHPAVPLLHTPWYMVSDLLARGPTRKNSRGMLCSLSVRHYCFAGLPHQ